MTHEQMPAAEEQAWRKMASCPWCDHGDEPMPGSGCRVSRKGELDYAWA